MKKLVIAAAVTVALSTFSGMVSADRVIEGDVQNGAVKTGDTYIDKSRNSYDRSTRNSIRNNIRNSNRNDNSNSNRNSNLNANVNANKNVNNNANRNANNNSASANGTNTSAVTVYGDDSSGTYDDYVASSYSPHMNTTTPCVIGISANFGIVGFNGGAGYGIEDFGCVVLNAATISIQTKIPSLVAQGTDMLTQYNEGILEQLADKKDKSKESKNTGYVFPDGN